MNSEKLRNLGWSPAYSLKDGLQATIEILKGIR